MASTTEDMELLLWRLDEMKGLGYLLGIEGQLQQFGVAVCSAGEAWVTDNCKYPGKLGAINEKAEELLEKIWCWHERHPRSGGIFSMLPIRLLNKIRFPSKIISELKKVKREYQLMAPTSEAPDRVRTRGTSPAALQPIEPRGIVGRDEDVVNIIKRIDQLRLHEEEDDRKLHIIPIVGMPGMGKTTVAKMVYFHSWVEQTFHLRIWVQFRDYYFVLDSMAAFLLGTDSFEGDVYDILKEKLEDKRYFLVLDGVWDKEKLAWRALEKRLLNISGAQGTVIVTSSNHGVAETTKSPPYELQGLSAADCLQLFRQLIREKELQFPRGGEDEELVQELIRQKCMDGWPPAVVDLTELLVEKFVHEGLTAAFRSYLAVLDRDYNSVTAFRSYLPIYLRCCLKFCSLFPEEHNYDKEELVEVWLALGYTKYHLYDLYSEETFYPERTSYAQLWEDYFFRTSTEEEDKFTYKMHHSVHQFAKHLSIGISQMMTIGATVEPLHNHHDRLVHLSLLVDSETSAFPKDLSSLKNLKTLVLLREPRMLLSNHRCKISRIPPELFARIKYLCVLDMKYTMIKKLPCTVGKLLNLRYLDLSGTDIRILPRCIGKLQSLMFLKLVNCQYLRRINDDVGWLENLQKLDIAGCHHLVRVPQRLNRQLKCFNIKDCSSIIQMPSNLGDLRLPRILPRFIVGETYGYTIKELKDLEGLEGELRIENLQKVASYIDAATARLSNKSRLKSLTLQWNWNQAEEEKDTEAIEEVLDKLRPNYDLIKLEIISYMGKKFPNWMSGVPPYFDSLKEIKLFNLKLCQALPPLGVLPHLRVAEISGMDAVTMVDEAFYGAIGTFPSLQKLTFSQMLKLERWLDVDRRDVFPHLKDLMIINCPQMVALEMELPSVMELSLWLNNEHLYSSKGGLKGLSGSLKKISICLCEQLRETSECQGLQELRALEEMEIYGCQELKILPRGIRRLNSLKSLTIIRCNKMRASPNWSNDELTSLCSLSINGCNLLPKNASKRG